MENYEVTLDLFKGPLDLLLYLVRKDEISVRDIEISRITDQYLGYIEIMKSLNLTIAGEFLVMATVLMRLKAAELLPQDERAAGAEGDDFIDREKLIRQIEEYERYKKAADKLRRLEDENLGTFYRAGPEHVAFSHEDFLAQKDVEIYDLLVAFKAVMEEAKKELVYYMEADNVTIDDRIEHIMAIIADKRQCLFSGLFLDDRRKIVIVVTFIKMGHIGFRQEGDLAEISIYERDPDEIGDLGPALHAPLPEEPPEPGPGPV